MPLHKKVSKRADLHYKHSLNTHKDVLKETKQQRSILQSKTQDTH